jgi:2-polyprenyl-3-methyl-5-hydroxy-6-metoxy-1,4-benzoquinol methylase
MHEEFSLERIVPDQLDMNDSFDQETLRLHLERYSFAIRNGRPGYILDMACGTGYGAHYMMHAENFSNSRFSAVDIDNSAILYAQNRYASDNIQFVCADAFQFISPDLFDTIVSLETIEHLKDPSAFVKKLYSLLKPDGILIVSAPVTPSTDGNPHHLSDFSTRRFKKLFESQGFYIQSQLLQLQSYSLTNIFGRKNKRIAQKRQHLGRYYFQHPAILLARIRSLMAEGLKNKYLTLAVRKNQVFIH